MMICIVVVVVVVVVGRDKTFSLQLQTSLFFSSKVVLQSFCNKKVEIDLPFAFGCLCIVALLLKFIQIR